MLKMISFVFEDKKMPTKLTKNQQFFVVMGIGGHHLAYSTVSCKESNKCLPGSIRLGTIRKFMTKSTKTYIFMCSWIF